MYGGDEVNALVVDVGSHKVKSGYAGEDWPKSAEPSVGARPAPPADGSSPRVRTGAFALSYPESTAQAVGAFEGGAIANWDVLEETLRYVLRDRLRVTCSEHPLLLSFGTQQEAGSRERLLSLLFEEHGFPAVFLARSAVLTSFALGRQTALVVDCGHQTSTVAGVLDGYALLRSVQASPLAGQVLTRSLVQSLEEYGVQLPAQGGSKQAQEPSPSFRRYHREDLAASIKVAVCRVADAPLGPGHSADMAPAVYELPDGTEVQLGDNRVRVPEGLFQPALLNLKQDDGRDLTSAASLPGAVAACVAACDTDIWKELLSNVIVAGGTSQLPGLRERLEREVAATQTSTARVKFLPFSSNGERQFSSWIGGSILASLGSFQQMWMSRADFDEVGASLVHVKSP